ncbi:MAG: outer membrane protein assembly factor BamD [Candidatus Brocadiia bacterium]
MQYRLFCICVLLITTSLYGCSGKVLLTAEEAAQIPPSPEIESQYSEAELLSKNSQYDNAIKILNSCVEKTQNPGQKEKVTFLLAECLFHSRHYEEAHKLYEIYLNEFSATLKFKEVLTREFEVGLQFISGAKRSLWGLYILPAFDFGLKIIKDTLARYPYAKPSETYHLKLADYLFTHSYFEQSLEEYELFISKYPQSSSLDIATYRAGLCHINNYLGSEYEITPLLNAKVSINELLTKYPQSNLKGEAQKLYNEIVSLLAERDYQVGYFYKKTGQEKAAQVYFKSLVHNYPQTEWAQKAKTNAKVEDDK